MKAFSILFAILIPAAGLAQSAPSIAPQTVEFHSGSLRLKAYLWKPSGSGPFPAVVFNHGRSNTPQEHTSKLTITEAAQVLGPVFARHGYVFLFPFRRGEGLSADQGRFIGDLLQKEEATRGPEARDHLQFVLMSTDHLADARAALSFVRILPYVDARRIAVAGHSFGGQLTLYAAAREPRIRAAIAFSPAAAFWERSAESRASLLTEVGQLRVPLMLIQTENDYSLKSTQAIADELSRLSQPYVRKIYPPVGETLRDGHNFLYSDVALWEQDVFSFLDQNMRADVRR